MYSWLQRVWYGGARSGFVLRPLSWIFRLLVSLRWSLYRWGILPVHDVGVPVIVVGNISAGGTGKTPLTRWLAARLRGQGLRVGIVMRGHGRAAREPQLVGPNATAAEVGDEALLLARGSGCPVAVGADRVAAARLLRSEGVDVLVSDDGLQHLRLARAAEIAVIDGVRRHGNGRMLPAGPLREPVSRLATVDAIVVNGGTAMAEPVHRTGAAETFLMTLRPGAALSLGSGERRELGRFRNQRVHAVAAIGHPQRFFAMLREHGLDLVEHPLPDHHSLAAADVAFGDSLPVLMTEKDAVKCPTASGKDIWFVPVEAAFSDRQARGLLHVILRRIRSQNR